MASRGALSRGGAVIPSLLIVLVTTGASHAFEPASSQRLEASSGQPGDRFGGAFSNAVAGDVAVVMAPRADHGAAEGSLYVFERTGGIWSESDELSAVDLGVSGFDPLGNVRAAVVLSAGTALFSGSASGGSGHSAYVLEDVGGTATVTAELVASGGDLGGIAIADDLALVGGSDSGSATIGTRVYERVAGAWMRILPPSRRAIRTSSTRGLPWPSPAIPP